MGQRLTEVEYLKAYGLIGLSVELTIDEGGVMYGCTHPLRRGLAEGVWVRWQKVVFKSENTTMIDIDYTFPVIVFYYYWKQSNEEF